MKFLVAVGTYERVLYGFDAEIQLVAGDSDESTYEVSTEEAFAMVAHTGYIKAVASSGNHRFLASGATDEVVRLFDLRRRREIGSLTQHNGPVTTAAFSPDSRYLITGDEVGRLALHRVSDWSCILVLKQRGGESVCGLAIHPSGKISLSCSTGRRLTVWNLLTGRPAAQEKLPFSPISLGFSPDGQYFSLLGEHRMQVRNTDSGKVITEWKTKQRLATIAFSPDSQNILVAGEGGDVHVIEVTTAKETHWKTLQEPRIKAICFVPSTDVLLTASSDGLVKGWNWPTFTELFSHDCRGLRITCMSASLIST